MGKYAVTYDEKAQSITMDLSGFFNEQDQVNFVEDFIKMSNKFKTSDTYLILDCGKLFLYPYEVFSVLRPVFEMYRDFGYKLVRMKLYKPQKELGRKFQILADKVDLNLDLLYKDTMVTSETRLMRVS